MSDEVERLQHRVQELEELLGMREAIPPVFKFTVAQEKIMGLLLRRESVSKDGLTIALWQGERTAHGNEPSPKSVEVQVMHLRKKLNQHGIEIETLWGRGYFMTFEMKAKCRALFESMREAA